MTFEANFCDNLIDAVLSICRLFDVMKRSNGDEESENMSKWRGKERNPWFEIIHERHHIHLPLPFKGWGLGIRRIDTNVIGDGGLIKPNQE